MDYYTLTAEGLKVKDFDIRHTVESGQPLTFHADYDFEKGFVDYVNQKNVIKAKFNGTNANCEVKLTSDDVASAKKDFVKRFRLNDNMKDIYNQIGTDEFMLSAIQNYRGMRITLNDPWETTLCFIMSQYNNVKRIRLIVKNFIRDYGNDILDDDGKIIARSFPTSVDLMKYTEKDFRKSGAGFRAKYMTKAAEYCTNNLDLYKLQNKSYDKVKESLMEITGVGDKVADCIALMGYGKMEAFPIDVWVKRTLERVYFKGKKKKIPYLHKFAEERWGPKYAAQAQQYIFWNGRNI